jgi:hypothetical protein
MASVMVKLGERNLLGSEGDAIRRILQINLIAFLGKHRLFAQMAQEDTALLTMNKDAPQR